MTTEIAVTNWERSLVTGGRTVNRCPSPITGYLNECRAAGSSSLWGDQTRKESR